MALSMLVDDNMSMNRVNPYTLTNTFGLPTDGMYKDQPLDGRYVSQIDENPSEGPSIFPGDTADHFSPLRLNMSGPVAVKTGYVNPAPYPMYPARKYQYIDGSVSFVRPDLLGGDDDQYSTLRYGPKRDNTNMFFLLVVLAIVFFIYYKKFRT
jgi:hypothetical protein